MKTKKQSGFYAREKLGMAPRLGRPIALALLFPFAPFPPAGTPSITAPPSTPTLPHSYSVTLMRAAWSTYAYADAVGEMGEGRPSSMYMAGVSSYEDDLSEVEEEREVGEEDVDDMAEEDVAEEEDESVEDSEGAVDTVDARLSCDMFIANWPYTPFVSGFAFACE